MNAILRKFGVRTRDEGAGRRDDWGSRGHANSTIANESEMMIATQNQGRVAPLGSAEKNDSCPRPLEGVSISPGIAFPFVRISDHGQKIKNSTFCV